MKTCLSSLFFMFYIFSNAQVSGILKDDRDSRVYKTVTYTINQDDTNTQMTWFAENLKYETEDSYCYEDYNSNCEIMGRIYSWNSAKNACPKDWHLPNDDEWKTLVNLYGGLSSSGKHLKSKNELWAEKAQGTNQSLFDVLPYGSAVIGSGYYAFKINTVFWSATEIDNKHAHDWVIDASDNIRYYKGDKAKAGNFVRCVKD